MGVIGGIIGGLSQASAAKSAARSQEAAANKQIELAKETRDMTRADLAPYVQSGSLGQAAYMNTLGLGAAPMIGGSTPQVETYQIPGTAGTGWQGGMPTNEQIGIDHATTSDKMAWMAKQGSPGTAATTGYRVNGQTFGDMASAQAYANANQTGGQAWGGYEQSPGYQFQLEQGMDALQSSAAAGGGLGSGRTMTDAMKYGQGLASQDFGNFQNRLAALGQGGQSAAAMQGDANTNYAQMGTNALGSIGNAQAAGKIGAANAFSDMMGNLVGAWGQQSATGGGGMFGDNLMTVGR